MSHYEPEGDPCDYECLVCSELQLTVATCAKCSILLCGNCLPSVSCCPQCKASSSSFSRNAFVEKHIKTIRVRCTLCSWAGDLVDFKQVHTVQCENVVVECGLRGCSYSSKRCDVIQHSDRCLLNVVRCEFCDALVQQSHLQEHLGTCVECKLCELCHQFQLSRSVDLHTHRSLGWCEASPVACTKCDVMCTPDSLAEHLGTAHNLNLKEMAVEILLNSEQKSV